MPIQIETTLVDSDGKVTSGTVTIKGFEAQDDGTLQTFDFATNTFKSGTVTTLTANMTHRTGNNGAYLTGLWNYVFSNTDDFVAGNMYMFEIVHTTAAPDGIWLKYIHGGGQTIEGVMETENETVGPPLTVDGGIVRLLRKFRVIGSKVVRNRQTGRVAVRNNEDTADLSVEEHSVDGNEDMIERIS